MTNATSRPCAVCGIPGQRRLYCSTQCKHRADSRRRRGKPIADAGRPATRCPVCGSRIEDRKRGARYCSDPCAGRASRRRRSGQVVVDPPAAKTCAHCKVELVMAGLRRVRRFCSSRCSFNYHSARYASRRRPLLLRRCPVCATDIPAGERLSKKYCSAECRSRRDRSPEVVFRYVNARRAKLAGASAKPLPKRILRRIRAASCFYCGRSGGTVDHVVPLSRGGQHAEGNLVPACRSCNSSKGDKLLIEWLILKRVSAAA
jgi:5-methylcytosine-specific restriction endonuclease McrA